MTSSTLDHLSSSNPSSTNRMLDWFLYLLFQCLEAASAHKWHHEGLNGKWRRDISATAAPCRISGKNPLLVSLWPSRKQVCCSRLSFPYNVLESPSISTVLWFRHSSCCWKMAEMPTECKIARQNCFSSNPSSSNKTSDWYLEAESAHKMELQRFELELNDFATFQQLHQFEFRKTVCCSGFFVALS